MPGTPLQAFIEVIEQLRASIHISYWLWQQYKKNPDYALFCHQYAQTSSGIRRLVSRSNFMLRYAGEGMDY